MLSVIINKMPDHMRLRTPLYRVVSASCNIWNCVFVFDAPSVSHQLFTVCMCFFVSVRLHCERKGETETGCVCMSTCACETLFQAIYLLERKGMEGGWC